MNKKIFWLNIIVLAFFILDRVLKEVALKGFAVRALFLEFSYFPNPNIALGIPLRGFLLYFLLTIVILTVAAMLYKSYKKEKMIEVFSWTMILVGTFSNLLDRFKYGLVIDYFNLSFFTVLNLADVAISLGVIILIWRLTAD